MVSLGHSAIGFSIGFAVAQNTNDPIFGVLVAGTLGIISHFITDFIPHGHLTAGKKDPYSAKIIYLDVSLSIVLFAALSIFSFGISYMALVTYTGAFAGLAPDFVSGLAFKYKKLGNMRIFQLENGFHDGKLHWHGHEQNALPMGARDIWQLAAIIFALSLPFWN